MQMPSVTSAISHFEGWVLPPNSGLKEPLAVGRYPDARISAAYQWFMQCFAWLESELKKQQGTNTPEILQNDKMFIHFVKLGDAAMIESEGEGALENFFSALRGMYGKEFGSSDMVEVKFNPKTHCVVPRETHEALQEFLKKVGAK